MLEQKRLELETRESALATMQQEWDSKVKEFTLARESLASLQNELSREITQIADQNDNWLNNLSKGQNPQTNNPAMEKFQKLCRDARRRAIGADPNMQ